MLSVKNLSYQISECEILDEISFSIHAGEKVGIIGENGTGKSTLLDILMGMKPYTKGEILWQSSLKKAILYQTSQFPPYIKVREVLQLFHRLNSQSLTLSELQTICSIDNTSQLIHQLSGGQKRMLDVALALSKTPDFLILDEPTNHLDEKTKSKFWKVIQTFLKPETSILIIMHDFEELKSFCDRIYMLENGKIKLIWQMNTFKR
ncbi:ABC transporter ATP-binding protein [Staphylococcus chromogenes]|uniref:ABC transporter ATP-binding protein n=1 Tax=Staphylococcus chromogenes TaxID=46126 RepID=UPI0029028EBD|nr:ATP-binding cassette domain-containing protein [Staphylococcus chromogenes]MDU0480208.1 ATP-binding cassette domain-containing protein [Staphylococcus chromogenes]